MHYSSLCSKILIKKGNIWRNRPVHGLLACYKRSYRILFFTIFSSRNAPSRRLNNNRNTSALVQDWGKTPPSNVNPPPLLIWAEGKHILVPREPPDHSSPSHYASRFPCFLSVSSSGSFPEYVPCFWVTITLVSYYIFLFFLSSTEVSKFVFSCKVQALEEFILFSLELVRKNYEKRSVEWGGVRTGWDERIIGTNLFS